MPSHQEVNPMEKAAEPSVADPQASVGHLCCSGPWQTSHYPDFLAVQTLSGWDCPLGLNGMMCILPDLPTPPWPASLHPFPRANSRPTERSLWGLEEGQWCCGGRWVPFHAGNERTAWIDSTPHAELVGGIWALVINMVKGYNVSKNRIWDICALKFKVLLEYLNYTVAITVISVLKHMDSFRLPA